MTTSSSNNFRESGIGYTGILLDPDPPVLLSLQACCPGHSCTFLQPQAFKYHLFCPSGPALTPQSTFFQPALTFEAVELVAEVTCFQSPLLDFPHRLPYKPSRILAVSSRSNQYCSKKLAACVPWLPPPGLPHY